MATHVSMECEAPGSTHDTTGTDGSQAAMTFTHMQGSGAGVILVCPVAQNGVCNGAAGLHAGLRHSATF